MQKSDRTNTTANVGAPRRADALETALAALANMNAADLRNEWVRHYHSRPPCRLSRDLLKLGVGDGRKWASLPGFSLVCDTGASGGAKAAHRASP